MVTCWKYFGAIVLKLALLKSTVTTNAASGYTVSCSLIFLYSSLSAWSVLAWGGNVNSRDYDRCKFPQ